MRLRLTILTADSGTGNRCLPKRAKEVRPPRVRRPSVPRTAVPSSELLGRERVTRVFSARRVADQLDFDFLPLLQAAVVFSQDLQHLGAAELGRDLGAIR